MKHNKYIILPLAAAMLLCGCVPGTGADTTAQTGADTQTNTYTSADMTTQDTTDALTQPQTAAEPSELFVEGQELTIRAARLMKIPNKTVDGVLYKQLQGGCTDGKYAYFAQNDTKSEDSHSIIYKIDIETLQIVAESEPLQLDHSNDMTYNENTGWIIVVNNAPNRDKLTFVDPQTLTVVGTKQIALKIFSIQYNASRNCYVVGCSGGQNFALLDSQFTQTAYFEVESTGYTTQGVDADDKYIYFIQYAENVVVVYDWDGARVALLNLPVRTGEPECIFHIGSTFYFGYSNSGILMYKGVLTAAE